MLRKMLFQGLFAAAIIAGGAALYAVTAGAQPQAAAGQAEGPPPAVADTGYIRNDRPLAGNRDHDGHEMREKRERHEMRDRRGTEENARPQRHRDRDDD